MADRWVLDPDHPDGHLVPMTPAEQAQNDQDQAAGRAAAERAEALTQGKAALVAGLAASVDRLADAQIELALGGAFTSLDPAERAILDALLLTNLQLARLTLERFDET